MRATLCVLLVICPPFLAAQSPRSLFFVDPVASDLLETDSSGTVRSRTALVGLPWRLRSDPDGTLIITDGIAPWATIIAPSGTSRRSLPNLCQAICSDGMGGAFLLCGATARQTDLVHLQADGPVINLLTVPGTPTELTRIHADHLLIATRDSSGFGRLFSYRVTAGSISSVMALPSAAISIAVIDASAVLVAGAATDRGLRLAVEPGLQVQAEIPFPAPTVQVRTFLDGTSLWFTQGPTELTWILPSGQRITLDPGGWPTLERMPDGNFLARVPSSSEALGLGPRGLLWRRPWPRGGGHAEGTGLDVLITGDLDGDADGDGFTTREELSGGFDPLAIHHAPIVRRQRGPSLDLEGESHAYALFIHGVSDRRAHPGLAGLAASPLIDACFVPGLIFDRPYGFLDRAGCASSRFIPTWRPGALVATIVSDRASLGGWRVIPPRAVLPF